MRTSAASERDARLDEALMGVLLHAQDALRCLDVARSLSRLGLDDVCLDLARVEAAHRTRRVARGERMNFRLQHVVHRLAESVAGGRTVARCGASVSTHVLVDRVSDLCAWTDRDANCDECIAAEDRPKDR